MALGARAPLGLPGGTGRGGTDRGAVRGSREEGRGASGPWGLADPEPGVDEPTQTGSKTAGGGASFRKLTLKNFPGRQ